MANDPNTYSYSSSTVMSYSNDGRGEPKYFQASKSTKRAPGGVSSCIMFLKCLQSNALPTELQCNLATSVGRLNYQPLFEK